MAKNQHSKRWIFGIAIAVLVILLAEVIIYYNRGLVQGTRLSSVTVYASGYASAAPTNAELYLYLNYTSDTTANAVQGLARIASALNSTLYPYLGGNMSAVTTTGYNTYVVPPQYFSNSTRNRTLYEASENIEVKLTNMSKVSQLLIQLSKVNGASVSYASFGLSNSSSEVLKTDALTNAIDNATAQADAVIGTSRIVYKNITIGSYYITPLVYGSVSGGGGAVPGTLGPKKLIFNGTVTVSRSVTVTFYYEAA